MRSEPAPTRAQRAPATRDQVDAYRFGLRRLEAALVRGDPVPLHEQLRAQRRAVFAGMLVGLLALGVTALLARVDPATDWRRQELVRGERSGVLYAVATDPARLVPVPDPVAGRLVLAALGRGGAAAVPVPVPDDALAAAPRTPPAGVAGTVGVPLDGAPVPAAWAVCGTAGEADRPGPLAVLAGSLAPDTHAAVPPMLLSVEGGSGYLLHGGRRHRVDVADRDVLNGLGMLGAPVRRIPDGLLSPIPEGPPLRIPEPGPVDVPGLGRAGQVVLSQPLGAPPAHYLVVDGGLAPIPVTLADAVLSRTGQGRPAVLAQGRVATAPSASVSGAQAWPPARSTGGTAGPVLCATWRDGRAGVMVGDRMPVAPGAVPVGLAGADGAGPRLDEVVLPASGPGPLRDGEPGGTGGTRRVLTASGAVHGVADDPTAAALGIGAAGAAPAAMVRLLPRAGVLDLAAARAVTDVPG
ncbi:type VII secretion protein EccB [Pseudonocardia nantongensis]|uniref:type VII secretion protein EccB n=1 Tax=Pseudonocardia nantongensis TaxID=1181885 RepID=UPI00397C3362